MSKTSAAVKNRYAAKVYDRVSLIVPKGQKAVLQAYAASQGKSLNAYIVGVVEKDMQSVKGSNFSLFSNKGQQE